MIKETISAIFNIFLFGFVAVLFIMPIAVNRILIEEVFCIALVFGLITSQIYLNWDRTDPRRKK